MIYLILAILVVLPLIVSGVLILKSKIDLSLAKAYMLEMIIMLIIGAIGHFYYHQAYGLNYFPTWSFAKFFLILFLVMTIVLFLIQLFLYWFKKKEILSFQSYMILFIGMSLFFVWIIPLGQKYVYIDRLDDVEEMFAEGDPDKVIGEDDVKVGLVASEHNKVLRSRYPSSAKYNNYVYLKNNKDSSFTGDVYLFIDTKYHSSWESKIVEDIKVDPQSTQLLVMPGENELMSGKWEQRSFVTDEKIINIEAKIVSE